MSFKGEVSDEGEKKPEDEQKDEIVNERERLGTKTMGK